MGLSIQDQMVAPSCLIFFTTAYKPFLLMVRIASVESLSVIQRSSSARKKRFVCRLGKNRRFVLIFEWETLLPETGLLPVT